jgi:hypothetical protein
MVGVSKSCQEMLNLLSAETRSIYDRRDQSLSKGRGTQKEMQEIAFSTARRRGACAPSLQKPSPSPLSPKMPIAYHCTKNKSTANKIMVDVSIKPTRMQYVYLFADIRDATGYSLAFNLPYIIVAQYDSKQVSARWKPKYAPRGVVKLKAGEVARVGSISILHMRAR